MSMNNTSLWLGASRAIHGASFIAFGVTLSHPSFAALTAFHPTEEKTFIQLEGQGWQVLGFAGDEDLPTKMAIAMTAKRKGQPVELTFNNGHDKECLSLDESSPVIKIKARKEKKNQG